VLTFNSIYDIIILENEREDNINDILPPDLFWQFC